MIFERDNRHIFFIHIPKTGGTSARRLLESEGWTWINKDMNKHLHYDEWSKHDNIWDFEFTITRNPYERFLSQARYIAAANGIKSISPQGVLKWAETVFFEHLPYEGKSMDDNHFRPQVEFIGENTNVYRLEDQIDAMIDVLVKENIVSKGASFPHENASHGSEVNMLISWPLVPKTHNEFLNFYCDDFINLEYSTDVPTYGSNINWEEITHARHKH